MEKRLKIPFIKSRGWECGQTCAAMMIKYFKPKFEPNFEEFNKMIHHVAGNNTFPLQNAILLDHYGIEAKCFSSDDIPTTKEDPNIFKKWFGNEYEKQMKFVDIDTYDWMAKEGRRLNLFEKKKTTFNEIIGFFKKGYLAAFPIDWNTLIGNKGGYQGHFVILSGIKDENNLYIHDPDVGPYVEYSKKNLEKAYRYPIIADDLFVAYGRRVEKYDGL